MGGISAFREWRLPGHGSNSTRCIAESPLRAHTGSIPLPTLADAAMKSTEALGCNAARKAAVHSKRSEFSDAEVRDAGRSRLMLMQRDRPPLDDQNSELVAAVRHVFPKAAVQNCQNGRNLNRTFAASVMDVSVADGAVLALKVR